MPNAPQNVAVTCASIKHACRIATVTLLSLIFVTNLGTATSAETTVDFTRDIRPILSDKCFFCHGPDEEDRQADLRLDEEDAAKESVIVPGDLAESELIRRILSADEEEQMPPPDSGKSLTKEEAELLKRWVQQGAPWAEHWSFVSPRKPPLPDVDTEAPKSWGENPIDRFVLHELRRRNMQPSNAADRNTLIRRVTLDLTGLPPTLEEVETFVANGANDAYEQVVDRLLASEAYSERMTLAWMDAARYGDTSVMHADGPRDKWPWRDWVMNAYRDNKPFSEFLLEQLAGDFFLNATVDQKVATGFLRNNASSDEGGAFPEELRVEYVVDRVKTVFNVFQGLSAECAQCHSHKYDPISNDEYYGLFAFFNNAADPGMQSREGNQVPIVRIHTEETLVFIAEKDNQITEAKQRLERELPNPDNVNAWITAQMDDKLATRTVVSWHELSQPFVFDKLAENWPKHHVAIDQPIAVDKPVGKERNWTPRKQWKGKNKFTVQSKKNSILYLTVDLEATHSLAGELRLKGGFAYQVWRDGELINEVGFHKNKRTLETKFNILLNRGSNRLLVKIGSLNDKPFQHEWAFTPQAVPKNILTLAAKINAFRKQRERADLTGNKTSQQDGQEQPTKKEFQQLVNHYKVHLWSAGFEHRKTIADLQAVRDKREASSVSCMIMQDLPKVRPTYILDRGQYDSPKKDRVIVPETPEALGSLGDTYPRNRLGLAQWMVRDDHPLTARVAVNRYWYLLFGRGLVNTMMDFGAQGAAPTHPELLDWLAVDFRESGWDVKRAIKQMVMSQTYRQSAKFPEELKRSDPENRYLARASRFRLQGDFIRDQALALSGLLVRKVGGPGVKPYQPPGLWNEVSLDKGLRFSQDHGEALYRRSMYTYWKRSAPHPSMQIFDAPTREKCTVARPRTNTPLQALVTLNDVQFVEASRKLAERIMKEGGEDFVARLKYGYRLCTARSPRQTEIQIFQEVYEKQLASFSGDKERAKQYLAHGESKQEESLPLAEHAAWSVMANMLLNLDEVLTRN